jgi:hypothetical protein
MSVLNYGQDDSTGAVVGNIATIVTSNGKILVLVVVADINSSHLSLYLFHVLLGNQSRYDYGGD